MIPVPAVRFYQGFTEVRASPSGAASASMLMSFGSKRMAASRAFTCRGGGFSTAFKSYRPRLNGSNHRAPGGHSQRGHRSCTTAALASALSSFQARSVLFASLHPPSRYLCIDRICHIGEDVLTADLPCHRVPAFNGSKFPKLIRGAHYRCTVCLIVTETSGIRY